MCAYVWQTKRVGIGLHSYAANQFVLFCFGFSDHVNLHRHRNQQINNWSNPSGLFKWIAIDRVKAETWNRREWWNKINALTRRIKITSNWKLIKTLQRNGKNSDQFKSHSLWLFHWHYSNGNLCGCVRTFVTYLLCVYILTNKYSQSYSFWVQRDGKRNAADKKETFWS